MAAPEIPGVHHCHLPRVQTGGPLMTRSSFAPLILAVAAASIGEVSAMTLSTGAANIVDMLEQSNDIVVGQVTKVEDGIDEHGVPFTEVTFEVTESIRGAISGQYKFRQFGLLAPRPTEDGKRTMMPAPEGFPKYTAGDEVVLMLRPQAKRTGFRMPAGITGGKFRLSPGRVENEHGNAGLFRNVHIENGLADEKGARMMASDGPAHPDTFLTFLRRAVRERWVETGKLTRSDKRRGPKDPPPSEPNGAHGKSSRDPGAGNPHVQPLHPTSDVAIPGAGR